MQVVAVVVTFGRPDVLAGTLAAIRHQSVPVEHLVVVDNDAETAHVRDIVAAFDGVYLPAATNLGYGAGIALGMRAARRDFAPALYWILDDDSAPDPSSLERLLPVTGNGVGVVANRGGHLQMGRIRHSLGNLPPGTSRDADFTLVDGALVSAAVVDAVGFPREDLFMMMEDFEYTTRAGSAGFRLVVVGGDGTQPLHLGSAAPWRHYYQTRNLLRIALDRRSPSLLLGWALREAGILVALARSRQRSKLQLRVRGTLDALRGKMGHTPGLP
jgi:GT2 family glycosyltransferase